MFTSGFFNSINSDRKYNAEQMTAIFDGLITDGIFDSIGDHFQVTPASSGLGVNIGTGRAWLNQTWSYNDTAYPMTLGAASPSLGRKDLICLKVDKSSTVRSNSLIVVAGTPAASPVEPTVADDTTNGIYYHKLAAVTVQAGATSISAADITNYIGLSTGTPYVTGIIESTAVDELWSQWDGEFNDWWDDIKATLDDNIVTTILNKIDHITPKEATMNLYGLSHINPPPEGKTYAEYSTDAILNQISSLLNGLDYSNELMLIYPNYDDPYTSSDSKNGTQVTSTVPVAERPCKDINGNIVAYVVLTRTAKSSSDVRMIGSVRYIDGQTKELFNVKSTSSWYIGRFVYDTEWCEDYNVFAFGPLNPYTDSSSEYYTQLSASGDGYIYDFDNDTLYTIQSQILSYISAYKRDDNLRATFSDEYIKIVDNVYTSNQYNKNVYLIYVNRKTQQVSTVLVASQSWSSSYNNSGVIGKLYNLGNSWTLVSGIRWYNGTYYGYAKIYYAQNGSVALERTLYADSSTGYSSSSQPAAMGKPKFIVDDTIVFEIRHQTYLSSWVYTAVDYYADANAIKRVSHMDYEYTNAREISSSGSALIMTAFDDEYYYIGRFSNVPKYKIAKATFDDNPAQWFANKIEISMPSGIANEYIGRGNYDCDHFLAKKCAATYLSGEYILEDYQRAGGLIKPYFVAYNLKTNRLSFISIMYSNLSYYPSGNCYDYRIRRLFYGSLHNCTGIATTYDKGNNGPAYPNVNCIVKRVKLVTAN